MLVNKIRFIWTEVHIYISVISKYIAYVQTYSILMYFAFQVYTSIRQLQPCFQLSPPVGR